MELATEGPEATNDDKNDEESIQDDESIHQKDCLDSPVRLSVWFATMTVPLICLLATWALVSVFSMASVSRLTSITTLIVEIADSQSNTVKDIQSSIAKQSSSANSFSDFLDDGKIDLLQQIQTSNEDQENLLSVLEGEIPRNRIEIEKSSGDVQTSLSRFRNSTRVGLSNKAERENSLNCDHLHGPPGSKPPCCWPWPEVAYCQLGKRFIAVPLDVWIY